MLYSCMMYVCTHMYVSLKFYVCDWAISEMEDSPKIGELRNGAKTKAGPLEAEQLSRLGNSTCQVTALHWRTLRSDTQTDITMFNFNVLSVRRHIRIRPDMSQLQLQLHLP